MRTLFTACMSTMLFFSGIAQSTHSIECETFLNEAISGIYIDMPNYRQVNSGTKLVVTYDEDCPEELRGAFEYAVKI